LGYLENLKPFFILYAHVPVVALAPVGPTGVNTKYDPACHVVDAAPDVWTNCGIIVPPVPISI
jgi:hypothetical protein